MNPPQTTHNYLSLPLSAEDLRVIARAAAQSDKSETEFILAAALEKAETCKPKPDATLEEMTTLLRAAQEEIRLANPTNRDLLQELLDERRAEAARE